MSNYASVNFLPEFIHKTESCTGVLNIERIGGTSEQKLRVQGHCKSCDAYLFWDYPLTDVTALCPKPVNVETTLQVVPPLPEAPVTDEDNKFLKAMKVKIN